MTDNFIDGKPTQKRMEDHLWILLFGVTIFLGAFLLFQVQPVIGKLILPWFGGSPGVWTTCMLVFQCLLFAGYTYAHFLVAHLRLKAQVILHCGLLLVAVTMLPIAPAETWKPHSGESPQWNIIVLLLAHVGAPYFLLSATGPLLQSWLAQSRLIDKPYRLYSLSNIGSMLALLSFPFGVEIWMSSSEQATVWSAAFIIYGLLCGLGAFGIGFLAKHHSPSTREVSEGNSEGTLTILPREHEAKDTRWISWLLYAMLPSMMLLATTNQVCQDTAVIPFLWIAPLAFYLLSFILTFESERWYLRRPTIQLAALCYLALYGLKLMGWKTHLAVEIGLYFAGLFMICMVCHGELYRSRPGTSRLTHFYLTISLGGALGGVFVGFIAPLLFRGFYEFPLALLGSTMLFLETYLRSSTIWKLRIPQHVKGGLAFGIPIAAVVWLTFWNATANQQLVTKRNFYGVLSVTDGRDLSGSKSMRKLVHGRVVHGSQFLEEGMRSLPSTYYTPTSGIGKTLNLLQDRTLNVGVVGLGAGTLATYGREGDRYRFYEINPDVIAFAKEHFTFLRDSNARVEFVLGDARLELEREANQSFDILVLDAFSGDAIPVHLLTEQAMDIYCRHLKEGGVLAIHISNLYFDLQAVVSGLADSKGFQWEVVEGAALASPDAYDSKWAILSKDFRIVESLEVEGNDRDAKNGQERNRTVKWTDDQSNLFQVLKGIR
ncbi:spermidine synthase [Pirellula sp. SH-Sr6A]|uniref:MFS transporter n=1 Tax=Pirellula sp. SH-Sr6A TaxID=1632865 RepID=UPI00078C6092|nr:spermidine synthase [Pirellula sp. SH-Sr6A]AMV31038.1 spermidine synthase [Pirellula sp. SH-Sr6A]